MTDAQKIVESAMLGAANKLMKVRSGLVMKEAFFGALLLRQTPEATDTVQAMATNGEVLKYNPDWVNTTPAPQVEFVCAHEAMHCALAHHCRMGGRDPDMWNKACDYAINPILVEAGVGEAPEGVLLDDAFANMSAEAIYNRLQGQQPPEPEEPEPEDEQQEDEHDDDQDQDESQESGEGESDDDGDESADDEPGMDSSDDGEGSPGDDADVESDTDSPGDSQQGSEQSPSYGGCGSIEPAPVGSDAEAQQEAQDWRLAAVQAANMAEARNPGDMPGMLKRLIDSVREPIAPWGDLLRDWMTSFSKLDYSWLKGNRRFLGRGMYLPSTHSEQLPPIAYVIDASISMPELALQQAGSELQQLIDELQPEYVDVYVHDTETRSVARYEPGEDISFDVEAGGGTRFAPTCQDLNRVDEPYACVVWFTDLEVYDWDSCEEPHCPVLFLCWVSNLADHYLEAVPAWGEVVEMEDF